MRRIDIVLCTRAIAYRVHDLGELPAFTGGFTARVSPPNTRKTGVRCGAACRLCHNRPRAAPLLAALSHLDARCRI